MEKNTARHPDCPLSSPRAYRFTLCTASSDKQSGIFLETAPSRATVLCGYSQSIGSSLALPYHHLCVCRGFLCYTWTILLHNRHTHGNCLYVRHRSKARRVTSAMQPTITMGFRSRRIYGRLIRKMADDSPKVRLFCPPKNRVIG